MIGVFAGIAVFGVAFVAMSVLYVAALANQSEWERAAKGEDE
jgi:hypothetical protein